MPVTDGEEEWRPKSERQGTIGVPGKVLDNMLGVIPAARNLFSRVLPRKAFLYVKSIWSILSLELPGLVSYGLTRRRLEVRGFGGEGSTSDLVKQLRSVNALVPTRMCRVMSEYGSDKGYHRRHNFTTVYSALFEGRLDQPLKLFELGIGIKKREMPSTMDARPGASLRAWRELFPNALVYGADIDRDILFQENRIKTFYCDQLDQASIRELWSQPELQGGADIIIEDGLHTFEANVSFLEGSLEHLRPGGIYIVEDIATSMVERWYDHLEKLYSTRYNKYDLAFVVLPNYFNNIDNNLLVIRWGVSK
ncbi:MAG: hypothetical protein ACT4O2_09475 [Beijerinckiaceae bacterium]